MKNFLFPLLLSILCVNIIVGHSALSKRDVHRIIVREEVERPPRRSHHRSVYNHRNPDDYKGKRHDSKRGKYQESDSLENSSFSGSPENSYERSESKNKSHPLRKPTRSPHHTTTENYRSKRQKQKLPQTVNSDEFRSNFFAYQNMNFQRPRSEYVPKFPDTFNVASSENVPHYYKFNHKNVDMTQIPKYRTHRLPIRYNNLFGNNTYEVYEDVSTDGSVFVPTTQLLRPKYKIKQQLSAEVTNALNSTKKERINLTRKRKVVRQRRRKV